MHMGMHMGMHMHMVGQVANARGGQGWFASISAQIGALAGFASVAAERQARQDKVEAAMDSGISHGKRDGHAGVWLSERLTAELMLAERIRGLLGDAQNGERPAMGS